MAFYVAATFLTPKLGIEFVLDDGAGISSGGNNLHHIHRLSHWISKIFLKDVLV